MFLSNKDPYIKVTRMQRGYGVRLFHANGELCWERNNVDKNKIGPTCRELLRMYDKCGGTKYTSRARHRAWDKATECDNVYDRNLRNKDMIW